MADTSSSARAQILSGIRKALNSADGSEEARKRLATHPRNLIPARAQLPHDRQVELFAAMATEVSATVELLSGMAEVPGAVADYLAGLNLPAEVRVAPDAALDSVPWDRRPTLTVTKGRARDTDGASLTGAFAGVAETGSLMLLSGAERPTTLNFLPDTHIVVLRRGQIVGTMEDAWDRLRAAEGDGSLPRTVNFITGPSRTGDIEMRIELGAHGPRRLHILLVED